ncbi:hypothetical protein B0A58_07740 [Flavobacterium branchiophilum NBRC 15030 = ATCC 35035]|uniref:Uncharacterized protein DUF1493 n=1 Tax=Flavobacterium branchiophilum TaxID=55197 RepID=A0A543G3E3_9FLAO|nr:DUF1493 family protein [Flavobacterium branchiophilum]OXA76281.1 hypothetical protein B0A58_07740 [Flavobacterium branchiophilum NBRC 15030 = ATCC 35035]TQM40534.1 uncharacterized protein DUF1493 [Flavobacterium branchiophilum]GEM55077.1 hypothetical protein FB1_12980 [Flavobacterium branchiophilum NBRC 15030 = ATCC 35035]
MITEKEIIDFIESEYWKSNLKSDSDIFTLLKINGNDCDDLLSKYAETYNVDMNDFLWYFHYQEEASLTFNFGNIFFKNPHNRVKEIPFTPKMLAEFAVSKKWKIDYPVHDLPKYRYDIIINIIILGILILGIILLKVKF